MSTCQMSTTCMLVLVNRPPFPDAKSKVQPHFLTLAPGRHPTLFPNPSPLYTTPARCESFTPSLHYSLHAALPPHAPCLS